MRRVRPRGRPSDFRDASPVPRSAPPSGDGDFALPRAGKEVAIGFGMASHKDVGTKLAQTTLSQSRILMVDDEIDILKPVISYFRVLGCRVVGAREPEEAQALLEYEAFDLIILDLGLTRFGTDGLEVVRGIREQDQRTPIIVLSAHVAGEVEGEALRAGADYVLPKPQPLADLAQVVLGLIGSRS